MRLEDWSNTPLRRSAISVLEEFDTMGEALGVLTIWPSFVNYSLIPRIFWGNFHARSIFKSSLHVFLVSDRHTHAPRDSAVLLVHFSVSRGRTP
jgi:hypothetical protein